MSILSKDSYYDLVNEIPKYPGNYLEIGVYEGDMLKDFATRWPKKTFCGIDPFISCKDTTGHTGVPIGERMESQRESAYRNFTGIKNIIFFECTSKYFSDTFPQWFLQCKNISVVYVDGNHSYDDTLNDLKLAARLIKYDGLIYIDDIGLQDVLHAVFVFMNKYRDRIKKYEGHRIVLK